MKLPAPVALAAAVLLGAGLVPALAQDSQAPAAPPVVAPQTATPATPQATTQPATIRPGSARGGDCAWKMKNLTS